MCGLFAALAFIVPRFVPSREGGFQGAGTAVLVFLGMLFGVAGLSIHLLLVTLKDHRDISLLPKLAGIGPSVVALAALVWLLGFLRY